MLQIRALSDIYIDGKPEADASLWQQMKGAFGIGVTTHPTGKNAVVLEYAGVSNVLTLLPKIGNLIPEAITRERTGPSPFSFGNDPLPRVKLYSNPRVVFLMPNGGQSIPTAMAKYNRMTNELVLLNTVTHMNQTMRELRSQVPHFQF